PGSEQGRFADLAERSAVAVEPEQRRGKCGLRSVDHASVFRGAEGRRPPEERVRTDMLGDRKHLATRLETLRIEPLREEASIAMEEQMAVRIRRIRIGGDQSPVFL